MNFTGERMIPGFTPIRIEEDHFERYFFASKYTQEKRVLDIACGVGYGAQLLVKKGKAKQVDAVDFSSDAILYAINFFNEEKINFIVGDILSYNSNETYDVIVCFETIEHIHLYKKALINIYDNLCDNGILILSSPNRDVISPENNSLNSKPKNIYHYHEFTIKEMIFELLSIGFSIDENNEIFGQRLCSVSELNVDLHDLKNTKSPEVIPIENQIPRYFTIIAHK